MNSILEDIEFPCIDETLVQDGFIDRQEGFHAAIRFKFKPMLPEEVDHIEWKMSQVEPAKARVMAAERMSQQLKGWDIKRKGQLVEITESTCRRLRPAVFVRLWAIIRGIQGSDLAAEWLEGGNDSKTSEELTAPSGLTVVAGELGKS